MRLIGIASHGNGAGKTRLLTSVLEAHPGRFGAVKFTTVFRDGQFCPKDARRRCACSRLHGELEVVTDPAILAQPDTDTGRMAAAGAHPLAWCLARPGAHAEAWEHVREIVGEAPELLTEGNTALQFIPADVVLFIVNPAMPRRFWKPDWKDLAARAHVVLVNEAPEALGKREPAGREERLAAMHEVQDAAPATPRVIARLAEPFHAWAGPLLENLIGMSEAARPAIVRP